MLIILRPHVQPSVAAHDISSRFVELPSLYRHAVSCGGSKADRACTAPSASASMAWLTIEFYLCLAFVTPEGGYPPDAVKAL